MQLARLPSFQNLQKPLGAQLHLFQHRSVVAKLSELNSTLKGNERNESRPAFHYLTLQHRRGLAKVAKDRIDMWTLCR